MSYSKEYLEHIPFAPPLALRSISSAARYRDALRLPFHIEATYLNPVHDQSLSYARFPCFPFHASIGVCDYSFEPAFIQKRNERERHRVRCVNEGYARLREHLPHEFEEKRLNKVETLRAAIDYIKHLQSLLDLNVSGMETHIGKACRRRTECGSDGESKTSISNQKIKKRK
uniref:Achaete-scute family bHLH transcription factor 4 n=1 Tax=Nothobranchius furzeri TaxID=105023 RepID=A0A8C6KIB0_NOTFU